MRGTALITELSGPHVSNRTSIMDMEEMSSRRLKKQLCVCDVFNVDVC